MRLVVNRVLLSLFGRFVVNRLEERSTWVGLGILLPVLGLHITPSLWDAEVNAGMAIAGLAAVLMRTSATTSAPAADPHALTSSSQPIQSAASANSGGGAG